jgi:hypothetical protein
MTAYAAGLIGDVAMGDDIANYLTAIDATPVLAFVSS